MKRGCVRLPGVAWWSCWEELRRWMWWIGRNKRRSRLLSRLECFSLTENQRQNGHKGRNRSSSAWGNGWRSHCLVASVELKCTSNVMWCLLQMPTQNDLFLLWTIDCELVSMKIVMDFVSIPLLTAGSAIFWWQVVDGWYQNNSLLLVSGRVSTALVVDV